MSTLTCGSGVMNAVIEAPLFTETYSAGEAADLLAGLAAYFAAEFGECTLCKASPLDVCRDHDEDHRRAHLAGLLADGLRAGGDEVLAGLLGLGRAARKARAR